MVDFAYPFAAQKIYEALQPSETRLVGGAVRAYMANKPWPEDLDMATTAPPEDIIARLQKVGINAILTGGAHGTVTAVLPHKQGVVEVTPLREDVHTDGRHATVRFTQDWQKDAARRDFTMNAVYLDVAGTLHDDVGGVADFSQKIVRFVGNAEERIREDYLRLLRYFRFLAQYPAAAADEDLVATCGHFVDGLQKLSAERVTKEFLSLLDQPASCYVLGVLKNCAMCDFLRLERADLERFSFIKQHIKSVFSCEQNLFFLYDCQTLDLFKDANILIFSNQQKKKIRNAIKAYALLLAEEKSLEKLAYLADKEAVETALMTLYADEKQVSRLAETLVKVRALTVPIFPLKGRDILARKQLEGAEIGSTLSNIENWWIEEGFPSKEACLAQLEKIL